MAGAAEASSLASEQLPECSLREESSRLRRRQDLCGHRRVSKARRRGRGRGTGADSQACEVLINKKNKLRVSATRPVHTKTSLRHRCSGVTGGAALSNRHKESL